MKFTLDALHTVITHGSRTPLVSYEGSSWQFNKRSLFLTYQNRI